MSLQKKYPFTTDNSHRSQSEEYQGSRARETIGRNIRSLTTVTNRRAKNNKRATQIQPRGWATTSVCLY